MSEATLPDVWITFDKDGREHIAKSPYGTRHLYVWAGKCRETREAAEARCRELEEALRKCYLNVYGDGRTTSTAECKLCGERWKIDQPERHSFGCLATLRQENKE